MCFSLSVMFIVTFITFKLPQKMEIESSMNMNRFPCFLDEIVICVVV